jgi:hypothetical protein
MYTTTSPWDPLQLISLALDKIRALCGEPYQPILLLEKNQYERIRRLRLIVYHHNLHLWYRVIYIGGIGWYRGIIESFISVA